jgi:hypothetical protein
MYQKGFRRVLSLVLYIAFIYVLYTFIQSLISEEKTSSSFVDDNKGGFKFPSITVCPIGQWPIDYQNLDHLK